MFFAIGFIFWRNLQLLTLIPTVGMLAWFVDNFNRNNLLTPNYILVLFIVSVLALTWALCTLFMYHRSSANALFVGFVDLLFVGAFIGGVYTLRHITDQDCTQVSRSTNWRLDFGSLGAIEGPSFSFMTNKPCAMLKASFAFGIMNAIMFFFTTVLAWMHGDSESKYAKRREAPRHHNRHRSGSGHSRRSSHSRRVYV